MNFRKITIIIISIGMSVSSGYASLSSNRSLIIAQSKSSTGAKRPVGPVTCRDLPAFKRLRTTLNHEGSFLHDLTIKYETIKRCVRRQASAGLPEHQQIQMRELEKMSTMKERAIQFKIQLKSAIGSALPQGMIAPIIALILSYAVQSI